MDVLRRITIVVPVLVLLCSGLSYAALISRLRVNVAASGALPWRYTVGVDSAAADGYDVLDAFAPPASPRAEVRLLRPAGAEGFWIDLRDGVGGAESWQSLSVRAFNIAFPPALTVTLTWDLSQSGGWLYTLQDSTNRVEKLLTSGGSYSFQMTGDTGPALGLSARYSPIAAAKTLADGSSVTVAGIVTAVFPIGGQQTGFYLEAADRSAGIQVVSASPVALGDEAQAGGTMVTISGERAVNASSVSVLQHGLEVPLPIVVTNQALCAGPFGLQAAVLDDAATNAYATGLNNVGLLVKVTGTVTHADPSGQFFYLEDGSGLDDGSGYAGVRVASAGLTAPAKNARVVVTGVAGVTTVNSKTVRLLKPRNQADIAGGL